MLRSQIIVINGVAGFDETATLPRGWKNGLVNLPAGDTDVSQGALPGAARSGRRQVRGVPAEGYEMRPCRGRWLSRLQCIDYRYV